jgi:hypothetical protein
MYNIGDKIPIGNKRGDYMLIIDATKASKQSDNTDLPIYKVGENFAIVIKGTKKAGCMK